MERALRAPRFAQVVIFLPRKWGRAAAATVTPAGIGTDPAEGAPLALHACAWGIGRGGGVDGTHRGDVSNCSDAE